MKKVAILILSVVVVISLVFIGKTNPKLVTNASENHSKELSDPVVSVSSDVNSLSKEDTFMSGIKNPHLVSHAGGEIDGHYYTNSKKSLDLSYSKGIRLMEVDFEWTTDNRLVALHSWNEIIETFFNVPVKQYSYEEFVNLEMINDWQQLTLETFVEWFEEHEDTYLITDLKRKNIKALELFATSYPHLQERIIPQIYKLKEYKQATKLGYSNIILTLYMSPSSDEEIIDFAKNNELFAVTMPRARAQTDLPKILDENGVYVYTHTVNDESVVEDFLNNGVSGFYTDTLLPDGDGIKYTNLENKTIIEINGDVVESTYYIDNDGSISVPLRKVLDPFGAKFVWNQETQNIIINIDDNQLDLNIDKSYSFINDEKITFDFIPFLNNGATMVSIDFIAYILGATINHDESKSTITIIR